jgi:predicted S18 family serine protease
VTADTDKLRDALETLAQDLFGSAVEEVRRRTDNGQITAAFQVVLDALDRKSRALDALGEDWADEKTRREAAEAALEAADERKRELWTRLL